MCFRAGRELTDRRVKRNAAAADSAVGLKSTAVIATVAATVKVVAIDTAIAVDGVVIVMVIVRSAEAADDMTGTTVAATENTTMNVVNARSKGRRAQT